jgi:hypothetical protein
MSFSFARTQKKTEAHRPAREGDPLLPPRHTGNNNSSTSDSGLRSRRTNSRSPPVLTEFGATQRDSSGGPMRRSVGLNDGAEHDEADDTNYQGFMAIHEDGSMGRGIGHHGSNPSVTDDEESARYSLPSKNEPDLMGMRAPPAGAPYHRSRSPEDSRSLDSNSQPPLLEIPEEIYAVRKAALKVLKPMMKTWVSRFTSLYLTNCCSLQCERERKITLVSFSDTQIPPSRY